jgi:hypothetical protein
MWSLYNIELNFKLNTVAPLYMYSTADNLQRVAVLHTLRVSFRMYFVSILAEPR